MMAREFSRRMTTLLPAAGALLLLMSASIGLADRENMRRVSGARPLRSDLRGATPDAFRSRHPTKLLGGAMPLPTMAPVFGNPLFYTNNETLEVKAADFDDDGDLDLAVGRGGSYAVSILLNNGHGNFADPVRYNMFYDTQPDSIDVGDVDDDGDVDIVAVGVINRYMEANWASVLYNAGDGTFETYWTAPDSAGMEPMAIRLAEIDGVNGPDMVVVNDYGNALRVFLNDGSGHYLAPANHSAGAGQKWLDVEDVDGDGDEDVVVIRSAGATVLLNDGAGNLAVSGTYAAGPDPTFITAADLDGVDGPDLAVSHGSSNGISVLLNDGAGAFQLEGTYEAGESFQSTHVVDVDNDGMADIVAPFNATGADGTVAVLPNLGGGIYGEASAYRTGDGALFVDSGDMDDDGWADLAVANDGPEGKHITVLLRNGDGTYTDHRAIAAGINLFPIPLAAADFDGDQVSDIVASDFGSPLLHFWPGNGDGTFAESLSFDTGGHQLDVVGALGDWDGDLDLDIAGITDAGAAVFFNDGQGAFVLSEFYPIAGLPGGIAEGDLDGDDDPDLAVSDASSPAMSLNVLLNRGDGTFEPPTVHAGGAAPFGVAIADVDGDNDLDVLLAADAALAVVRNNGDATFQAPELYDAGSYPFSIASAELNGDVHVDVALTDPGGFGQFPYVHVFSNNGDGTFAPKVTFEAGRPALEITAADLNSDGAIDLATANWLDEDSVSVLLNDGGGAFDNETKFHVGLFTRGVVAADFDGDGDRELASGSVFGQSDQGEISILLNRTAGCLGDTTGDRLVNAADLLNILGNWGVDPPFDPPGSDTNGDGEVDAEDLLNVIGNWGPCL
jgi:hypothetical protein